MVIVLALADVPTLPDERESEQPSPQHLRPCCPADACQYRPAMIRSYLFAGKWARMKREPWDIVLSDLLDCDCGKWATGCQCPNERRALNVQSNRSHGSLRSRARDIVLSLERCRDELGIGLSFENVNRLAAALCRFSGCPR